MDIAFASMIRKRAGWLTALFLGEMLTATAMGAFEHEISKAVVLALFVPLIISSGGNSGSQAVHARHPRAGARRGRPPRLVARHPARDVRGPGAWRRSSAASGSSASRSGRRSPTCTGRTGSSSRITVGLALVGIVLWGTLVGSLLPFILRRLGFRPGHVVGAVCRDAGGRDRAGDLLQRCHGAAARDAALTLRAGGRRLAAGGWRGDRRVAGGLSHTTHNVPECVMHGTTRRSDLPRCSRSASCCARLCRASTTRRRTHDRSSSIARPARRIGVAGSAKGRRGAAARRASVQRPHDRRRRSVPPVTRENALDQPGELHRRERPRRMATEGTGAQAARDLGVGWKISPSVNIEPKADVHARRHQGSWRHSAHLDDAHRPLAALDPAHLLGRRDHAVG